MGIKSDTNVTARPPSPQQDFKRRGREGVLLQAPQLGHPIHQDGLTTGQTAQFTIQSQQPP
eukprot:213452-Chlamydomonas_euryale.AAC.6